MRRFIAVFLIVIQFSGCASKGAIQSPSHHTNATYSSEEVSLGKQIHEQIVSRMTVFHDQKINDYVSAIGKKLAGHSKRKDLPYQFVILDDDRIYSTCAPGGFVYITTGFIKFSTNESELAAVLAHEIGELQRREPRLSKVHTALQKMMTGGAVVAPAFGNLGALALLGIFGVYSLTGNEPNLEKQLVRADRSAIRLMSDSEYDPQGLLDLENKILNASSKDLMYLYDYQQTRTVTEARMRKLSQDFLKLNLEGKNFDTNRTRFLLMTEVLRTQG